MTLIALIGDLGSGKTLGLTYFGYRAYLKHRTIFTNMNSLVFKDKLIRSILDLEEMREGFAGLGGVFGVP